MAPGNPIAGDATTADGGGSNHRRWSETSKVYTRKIKNPKTNSQPQPPPPPPPPPPPLSPPKPPPSAADDITPSDPPPPPDGITPASPPGDTSNLNGHQREDEEEDDRTVKIDLRLRSKDEIRELRRKFADELKQVRALSRKIESCFGGGGAARDLAQPQPSLASEANGYGEGEGFENEEREPNYCQLNGNCVVDGFKEEERVPAPDYCHLMGNGMIEGFEEERLASDYCHLSGNGVIVGFETEERMLAPNYRHLNGNSVVQGFEKEERTLNYRHLNSIGVIGCFAKEERTPKYGKLSVSIVPETNCGIIEGGFEKEKKRTPKANQLYKNSDFILIGNDKFPPELKGGSHKKMKPNGHSNSFVEKRYAHAFKSCATLLGRLMKHKFGWVFNTAVDVKGLGLHDYYSIIKHPMDLGTVKSRLNKNWYKSPGEFAEDVRLTFHNAMTYNPKGQDVHIMAQQLLQIFEERWPVIEAEYTYVPYPPTPVARKPPPIDVRMLERSDSTVNPVAMETKTNPMNYPAPTPTSVGRPPASRQPKPKAKDLYKREMTWEEKQKLSGHLQELPPAKLDGVAQIIRKRNSALCRQEDEIEIDIDLVDTETLWELDRFVTNYKKSLSKHKRKAEIALEKAAAERERGQERVMELGVVGDLRENTTVVDGIEHNSSFPVRGENKRENSSGSSSSSSSSSDSGSSSSDSDSDSSSASDAVH